MTPFAPRILALAAACLMPACVSILPEPKAPGAVYRLGPMAAEVGLSANLVVREPEAPALFAGRDMVIETANGGLKLVEGAAWSDRLTRLMQAGLIEALSGPGTGLALDAVTGAPGAHEIAWRIADLSLSGGEARCRLDLTILDGRTRAAIGMIEVSASVPAQGSRADLRAGALSAAGRACLGEAARKIAAKTDAAAEGAR